MAKSKKPIGPVKKGALHKEMGISKDKPISTEKLKSAESKAKKSGNTKEEKRIVFAENARKWSRAKKK